MRHILESLRGSLKRWRADMAQNRIGAPAGRRPPSQSRYELLKAAGRTMLPLGPRPRQATFPSTSDQNSDGAGRRTAQSVKIEERLARMSCGPRFGAIWLQCSAAGSRDYRTSARPQPGPVRSGSFAEVSVRPEPRRVSSPNWTRDRLAEGRDHGSGRCSFLALYDAWRKSATHELPVISDPL